jgi:squalene-hopene/tetraprenyl-beta-curcumene cyclase
MKLPAFLLILATSAAFGQAASQAPRHESLKQELRLGVERGLNFLRSKQNSQTGQWGEAEPVALTGLAMTAFMLDPNRKPGDPVPAEVEKATLYLISNAKPDGSITIKARATYNTAIALTALLLNQKPENEEVMLKARRYLVTRQLDLDEKGKQDNPTDGGIGYGEEKATHADLSNTTFALEALYYAQSLLADKGDAAKNEPQLNFGAAIDFIQRCQNRPESNKSSWVSKDPKDAGGFIYNPTETRGAKVENPDGTISLRSYGSISYAGLLSFIYAGLDKSDPRVKAVIEWISANYSADENPGLGAQGLYYYYHTSQQGPQHRPDRLHQDQGRQAHRLARRHHPKAPQPPKRRRLLGQLRRPLDGKRPRSDHELHLDGAGTHSSDSLSRSNGARAWL